ncbi:hypothetical protein NUW54_g13073 [Trametes sanguinea]|uniref:Uncharacterized protein n=1 Tax=Trametes sanguinea TaxID=158606 RepID=A0ACC1MQ82_9APHY|nr:hypothetical protein NUW54_g13073 [Trametes sanguinea]
MWLHCDCSVAAADTPAPADAINATAACDILGPLFTTHHHVLKAGLSLFFIAQSHQSIATAHKAWLNRLAGEASSSPLPTWIAANALHRPPAVALARTARKPSAAAGVVKRIRAICQSLNKANMLLRLYDISSCTPADELPERLLDLINDTRFAWPTELIAASLRAERGGHGVWRYVFDQEGPSRGLPHHAVDLMYLFDNVPLPSLPTTSPYDITEPREDGYFYTPDDSDDEDCPAAKSSTRLPPAANARDSDSEDEAPGYDYDADWAMPVVDDWTYARVRTAEPLARRAQPDSGRARGGRHGVHHQGDFWAYSRPPFSLVNPPRERYRRRDVHWHRTHSYDLSSQRDGASPISGGSSSIYGG